MKHKIQVKWYHKWSGKKTDSQESWKEIVPRKKGSKFNHKIKYVQKRTSAIATLTVGPKDAAAAVRGNIFMALFKQQKEKLGYIFYLFCKHLLRIVHKTSICMENELDHKNQHPWSFPRRERITAIHA